LRDAFSKFGKRITDEEIDEIMRAHDKDKNKMIDFNEFKIMMLGDKL
jgi:Ca2+-binding EF-hand superfamily protein